MTVSSLGLPARAPARTALPELLSPQPLDPGTALGRLFAPAPDMAAAAGLGRWVAGAPERLLGELADAARLLSAHERERAAVLTAWVEALMATAAERDDAALRLARLHRSAFLVARALAGEPSPSPFLRAFAAEAERRGFTRPALDSLLESARVALAAPRATTRGDWDRRAQGLGGAFAAALLGAEPSAATIDAAAALFRLGCLRALPGALAAGRTLLPLADLPEPLQYRSREELAAAIAAECESVRPLLLRGARAVAEAPLTFVRPLAFLLETGLQLLSEIEVHPEALLDREPRLGWWRRRFALRRARRERLG